MIGRATPYMLGLLFLAAPSAGWSQPATPSVTELIERGRALRREGRRTEALEVLERAHQLQPSPETAGWSAFAARASGRWLLAETRVREALASRSDPWVVANLAPLLETQALAQTHLSDLVVRCSVPSARCTVGGAALAINTPQRREVGPVELACSASGFDSHRRTITLAPGPSEVDCALTPTAPTPPPRSVPTRTVTSPGTPPAPTPEVPPPPPSNTGRTWAWATASGAVTTGLLGALFLVLRDGAASRWNDDTLCNQDTRDRIQECPGVNSEIYTMHGLMIGSFAVAGALGVTSLVLFSTSSAQRQERPLALRCGLGPGLAGIACGGWF